MDKQRQRIIELPPKPRGFHLITEYIDRALASMVDIESGVLHVFIQHTSASLCINENADPTVRSDLEAFLNATVREDTPYFEHTYEGSDDMPAHIKAALLGNSLSIPVTNNRLALGTWQGVYLGEHRNHGGARRIIITLI